MNRNQIALDKLYENLRLVCYQFPNYLSDFENEYYAKTYLDKKISETIKETLKTCLADTFNSTELVYNILNSDDDREILSFIEAEQSEA
jgi:hypothetical protein